MKRNNKIGTKLIGVALLGLLLGSLIIASSANTIKNAQIEMSEVLVETNLNGTITKEFIKIPAKISYEPSTITKPIEPVSEPTKIDPGIEKLLKKGATSLKVIITLRDQPKTGVGIDATAISETERATLIEEMKKEVSSMQTGFVQFIQSRGAKIVDRFWFINGMIAEIPASLIPVLENMDEVLYIQPVETDIPPPLDESRNIIGVSGYWNLGSYGTGIKIANLDTGINWTHPDLDDLDDNPSTNDPKIIYKEDLVTNDLDGNDSYDYYNHGTPAAGILAGTGKSSNGLYKGVAPQAYLISLKIYNKYGPNNTDYTLDGGAAVNAFQRAYEKGADIINAEIQASGNSGTDSISVAADTAYDRGIAVIAAAGNNGPNYMTITAPGSAHKALGVGAMSKAGVLKDYSGRGPASDTRIKPEIISPTDITTTNSSGGYTPNDGFTGTSGATPHVGGAAALIEDDYRSLLNIEPGRIYSMLIAEAKDETVYGSNGLAMDNNRGAGPIDISNTWYHKGTGKYNITQGQWYSIPITVETGTKKIVAALYWGEHRDVHSDIDLYITDASGNNVAKSIASSPVTERAIAKNPAAGTYYIKIHGYSVSGTQEVYYTYALWK